MRVGFWRAFLFVGCAVLLVPLEVAAQALEGGGVESLPPFLEPFASGQWWLVLAYGIVSLVVATLDANVFDEELKAGWPAWVRKSWDFLAMNIRKSRNAGSADAK